MSTTEYQVTAMTCGQCESAIRTEVSQIPGVTDIEVSERTTLSTSVQVAGDFDPIPTEPFATTTLDGYGVSAEDDLVAAESTDLRMTGSCDGEPVTELEPSLGAFGHLVMDVTDRIPGLAERAAGLRQRMNDERVRARAWPRTHGEADPAISGSTWTHAAMPAPAAAEDS